MAAKFREVTKYSGVDEDLSPDYQGIVVPLKGANQVMLGDGAGLTVRANLPSMVKVKELTSNYPTSLTADQTANLKSRALRLFEISADVVPGMDKAHVTAKDSKGVEKAKLKVLVLRPRPATISIRPVYVIQGTQEVPLTKDSSGAQSLVDAMNAIWIPQANVVFTLESPDKAVIKGISPQATGVDITNAAIAKELIAAKGSAKGLTAFMVNQALDNGKVVNGVTDAKAGIALISDNRRDSTIAHEAGHYLGAVDDKGKFISTYGHPGSQAAEMLMRDGGSGRKIPYGRVPDFNKGYTSK
ncbi:MAG: hypothetical protein WAM53_06765 [Terrimicrobiaceae bacterium]